MSSALEPVPSSGLVLGRYRPLRPLGSGGSGSVWLCHDQTAGIDVALKIIPREGRAEPRAEREAEAATRLRHPNCLRAYGLEADDGHLYIPYEYVPGITLRQALRSGRFGDDAAIESAAQVLDGLAFAHARGIVHRDVKPSNVLVAEDDDVSVRLFDFGLAQLADADTLTAVGDVPGTLAYISPERLHGEQAGPPADVWAVGVLLWEALAGHHPFWRESPLETGEEIKTGAPSIREARPDLPDRVVAAVDAALEVEPGARPSAAGLARELRDAWWERSPRRAHSRRPRLRFAPRRAARRVVPPALAALSAGWIATALPFYPELWPLLLATLAAVLTLLKPRLGLAFTLAVPVFPLGNVAFGLAIAYALVAAVWLLLMWGDSRRGLLCSVGLVLGPLRRAARAGAAGSARRPGRRPAHLARCRRRVAGRSRGGNPGNGDPVHGPPGRGARRRRERASDRRTPGGMAVARGDARPRARGADPRPRGGVARARRSWVRPDRRELRRLPARRDAPRRARRRGAAARRDGLDHVRRADGAVSPAARAGRQKAQFRRVPDTDTCAVRG